MQCGIYAIYHERTGKFYIGSSNDIVRRLREHADRILGRTVKGSIDLARLMADDPFQEIKVRVLSLCQPDELDDLEAYWMRLKKDGKLVFQNKTLYLSKQLRPDIEELAKLREPDYPPFFLINVIGG